MISEDWETRQSEISKYINTCKYSLNKFLKNTINIIIDNRETLKLYDDIIGDRIPDHYYYIAVSMIKPIGKIINANYRQWCDLVETWGMERLITPTNSYNKGAIYFRLDKDKWEKFIDAYYEHFIYKIDVVSSESDDSDEIIPFYRKKQEAREVIRQECIERHNDN